MLVVGFAAGPLRTNCYLLATGTDTRCVVVDPGQDAREGVRKALREHGLTPEGVLATHGHADHVASAAELAAEHGVAVWIHPGDRELLDASARDLADGDTLELAGLDIAVDHTPGHTPGSVIFRLRTAEGGRIALTGDTLFAGSIGRGDQRVLAESLRGKLLTLPDDTVVLPGHGQASTIGRERAGNPLLAGMSAR
ncbi:MBL fold metallo-hydrolase [Amycolatopsis sp. K13G38]|uniref:MBL fold metallo-hydrolase n=1 Tax=Amycolatopsis acididurans TaxID=2724524 RepID=A0ABX1IZ37_9PSEU|nr:MBL fold metallo-hydrolase [Amycolatopsis acididurans]NKQ52778.1 MBL fold metallo-hydrolase [Amycolatopsis acididurans]